MTAIKPATALPWQTETPMGGVRIAERHLYTHHESGDYNVRNNDARYLVHAANAYPKLVEALRAMLEADSMRTEISGDPATVAAFRLETKKQVRAILRELGESK